MCATCEKRRLQIEEKEMFFWNRKPNLSPLGVALGDLLTVLAPTTIKGRIKGNALIADHEYYTVTIEVVPPSVKESENGPIKAVVRVTTELPESAREMFRGRESSMTAALNVFTALGALYKDGESVQIGSRLTIYEVEDAWEGLHLPLLASTTICGAEAILGAVRRTLSEDEPKGGVSLWTEKDMAHMESYFSRLCLCSSGGLGFTAEFGLKDGPGSAMLGDNKTALFQLLANQPHPELGGGLFCLLQLPQQIREKDRLQKICLQLNAMEMAAHDLPPHFGAWCPGRAGTNIAYAMFLPNSLYSASGIAVNTGFWAFNRAQWANAMLASLGV